MWNYFFRVCVLNRTSVYLHLIVYVSDQLRTVFFILAENCNLLPKSFHPTMPLTPAALAQFFKHWGCGTDS